MESLTAFWRVAAPRPLRFRFECYPSLKAMQLFFIVALWILCVAIGLLLGFFKQLRFLSSYLILCSTGGAVASFVLSVLAMMLLDKVLDKDSEWDGFIILGLYVAGIVTGVLIGIETGTWAARKLNKRFVNSDLISS